MELTEKQKLIYERGVVMFKERGEEKKDAILYKVSTALDIELQEYTDQMVFDLLNDTVYDPQGSNLYTKFLMPPFTTLDTRNGAWLERRRLLDDYLGDSLVGRAEGLAYGETIKRRDDGVTENGKRDKLIGAVRKDDNGTSRFDSVLCEVLLKWFGFKGCNVLDPFAGGHTRGAMAALLGYTYIGMDLSKDQIVANQRRAEELGLAERIDWYAADALDLDSYVYKDWADLIFTCPPYGDLEQYTDDPRDLSNMDYEAFKTAYTRIIGLSLDKLRDNRFAVVVVGDFRDKQGFYRGFVADTIKAFEQHGVKLYNEAVLLNSIGTASMRASSAFVNRKLTKVHQNVLVFYKGDPGKIKSIYGTVDNSLPIPIPKQNALF